MKLRQELGTYLAKQRARAGLTQDQVARQLNYSTAQFISNWERGISSPPLKVLRKLTQLYGIGAEEMFNMLLSMEAENLRKQLGLKRKAARA